MDLTLNAGNSPLVQDVLTPGGYYSLLYKGSVAIEEEVAADDWVLIHDATGGTAGGKIDLPCLSGTKLRFTLRAGTQALLRLTPAI
jgi:hypothetical protein